MSVAASDATLPKGFPLKGRSSEYCAYWSIMCQWDPGYKGPVPHEFSWYVPDLSVLCDRCTGVWLVAEIPATLVPS